MSFSKSDNAFPPSVGQSTSSSASIWYQFFQSSLIFETIFSKGAPNLGSCNKSCQLSSGSQLNGFNCNELSKLRLPLKKNSSCCLGILPSSAIIDRHI